MSKRIIISIGGILLAISIIICGFRYFNIALISEKVVTELGEDMSNNVSDYANGNITNAELDLSNVNIQKTGVYKAYISNMSNNLPFNVEVVDTIPPSAESIKGLTFIANYPVKARELVANLNDKSSIIVTYADGKDRHIYTNGGTVSEKVILTDESDNRTEIDVTFQVLADTVKPVIKGVKAITIYVGQEINYKDSIKAIDDREGDLTANILVNTDDVNLDKPGKYAIIYSVSDSSGNEAIKKTQLTVLEDKSPTLKGLTDKTIYINETIDYFKGITAVDDRDGDLASKIEVDSSLVDIKRVGTYAVVYTVTDSNNNTTKKIITITVKKKDISSSSNSKSSNSKSSNSKSSNKENKKNDDIKSNSSDRFQFFDVKPEGNAPDGDVPAGGKQDVGTWG